MARHDDPLAPWCVRPEASPRNSRPPWMEASPAPSMPPEGELDGPSGESPPEPAAPVVPAAEHLALVEEHAALVARHAALAAEHATLVARLARLTEANDALARDAETVRERVLAASEPELVRLACAVAGRVVGRELRADPALVVSWAREAVAALDGHEAATVVLAPDVEAAVPAEAWARSLGADHAITVDPTLPPGAVSVRSGASTVDVGAAARLAAVTGDLFADLP
jgi:flagellar biosynthesis/type III secretory pathway protein FliH